MQFGEIFIQHLPSKSRSTTKVFITSTHSLPTSEYGRLFGLLEINTPNRENEKIIEELIQSLHQSFYSQPQESPTEQKLEDALKVVNERIQIKLNNEPSLLVGSLNKFTFKEKVSFIVGVVAKQEVHLSSVNFNNAFLLHKTNQGYRLIDIIKSNPAELADEKIFSSVISGEFIPDDYLFFCNTNFLNFVSKERINKTITSLPVARAADYFKNSLLNNEGFNFAGLIIKGEPEIVQQTPSPAKSSIDDLRSHESKTEKILSPTYVPKLPKLNLTPYLQSTKKHFADFFKFSGSKLKGTVNEITGRLKNKQHDTQPLPVESMDAHQPSKPKINFQFDLGNKLKNFNSSPKVNHFKNSIKGVFTALAHKINTIPNISKVILGIFIILLGFFAYSIFFLPNHAPWVFTGQNIAPELKAVEATLTEAEAKVIYKSNDEARALIISAEEALKNIKVKNNAELNFVNGLTAKINSLVTQLRQITLVSEPTLITSLSSENVPAQITDIEVFNGYLIAANNSSENDIYKVNLNNKLIERLNSELTGAISKVRKVDDANLFGVSIDNKFYKIKDNQITPLNVTLQPSDIVTDFAYYNDRLYTLIPSKNQIYRHPAVNQGFGAGITWIQDPSVNLNNGNGIAIDTSIWVSTPTGQVIKLFKGRGDDYAMPTIDPKLEKIDKMVHYEGSPFIYLLDKSNNRVVVIKDDGTLVTQYFSPLIQNINSIAVDEKSSTLFLADKGTELYAIIMTHQK